MGDPQGLTYTSHDDGISCPENPHIMSIDVGTTTVRCHIYDRFALNKGTATRQVELLHPQPGWVEMDEELLWQQIQDVVREALAAAGLTANQIACLGITAQRNTFILWDRKTGIPYHHFITWQDLRASDTVKTWNNSITMKGFNKGAKALHTVTRKKRFLSASVLRFKSPQVFNYASTLLYWLTGMMMFLAAAVLRFSSPQVTMRLKWVFDTNPELLKKAERGEVCFGMIETWLLWKLTKGEVFATDYSFASSTGMYDPFQLEWSTIMSGLVKLPIGILPPVKDTSGLFGYCSEDVFGARIPITAVVADQQGSMFGQCCFKVGDIKCTMGTGTFLDLNTGSKPHASVAGLYPLVGWKYGSELVFIAEGLCSDTGRCIDWAQSLGMFDRAEETAQIAESVSDSDGVYFVPSFSGLQAPINDDKACAALLGMTEKSSKAHIVRAILESLTFRCKLLYETMLSETKIECSKTCKVDGGVCKNKFIMQVLSDLTGCDLVRPVNMEMSSLGATFLAGLAIGVWKNKEEVKSLHQVEQVFRPTKTSSVEQYKLIQSEWERAVKRTLGWHKMKLE